MVAFAVVFHHDYCDPFQVIKDKNELINNLLKGFKENIFSLKPIVKQKINAPVWDNEIIMLKGLLHKCDYSDSGGCVAELKNDFLNNSMECLLENWKKENVGSRWNEMQTYCKEHSDENIIVVAQTGMGKTEGALHWIGDNKGFFLLPLRTAINAMYCRIIENIVTENINDRVVLMHSEALSYLLSNKIAEPETDILKCYEKAKKLAMPLTVTTMDQLFDFVYCYNGFEMKLATFSYSKIVIDEIQMYSPDLLACLICGIEKIYKIGGKIAIFTATLAPFIRDLLLEKVNFNYHMFLDKGNACRHHVVIKQERINAEDILLKYSQNEERKKPNKILVVCNTVRLAQKLYTDIKKRFNN